MNEMFSQGGKGSTGILTNKQAIARKFGVKQSEVVYFSVGVDLGGYKVIYDKATQRAYSLPADIGSGVTAVSLSSAGVLVHSAGNVDLGALAVTREEYVTLSGSFDTGVTVNTKNELVVSTAGKYRWDGGFPKIVPAGSTPETAGGIGLGAWLSVGDSVLRSQISNPNGASLYPALQIARWRDEGDIRGWGAKCNGVADDTAAIQSAITEANGAMIKLKLPKKSVVKIMGTILVPGGVSIDLNHSIIEGNGSQTVVGTNVIFESAYWDEGELKSNWSVPAESVGMVGLVPDMRIYGGRIRFAQTAVKMYQMIYGSSVEQLRITACGFPVIIKDSFYGTFDNIAVVSPPSSVSGSIGFQIESNIQAMGVRKCVAAGFHAGWKITGSSATDCFDTCTAEHCTRGVDIYGSDSGNIQNLELHNWYFEKNTIGIRVDPSAIVERLYIKNSYLHWQMIHLEASTVLSGGIDKSCNFKDGADPSGTNWRGDFAVTGRSGEKTFIIEIEDYVNTIQNGSSIPSNYLVGKGVEIKRIETLTDSSGAVIARNLRQTSTAPKRYTGQTISTELPSNSIPFCTVNTNDPARATIATQVVRSPYNIVHINLLVTDNETPINACGTLFGSYGLMQPSGAKPMTITYDENNRMTIAIAGTSITNVQGIIQVV